MADDTRIDKLETEVEHLAATVEALQSAARAPGDDVIYRPPLWSQESAYSAADDRRLIHAALWPGVIDSDDLKVVPRQEGANLTVDVLPGEVVIPGTEQVDQGNYLCALAQRQNIRIDPGPAAGNYRHTWVIARVYEPVDAEAYWQVEAYNSNPTPIGTFPPTFPPQPPSFVLLADILNIQTSTSQITDALIRDYRRLSRPGPTASSFAVEKRQSGFFEASNRNFEELLGMFVLRMPLDLPLDLELRAETNVAKTVSGDSLIAIRLYLAVGPAEGVWLRGFLSDGANVTVHGTDDWHALSRSLVIPAVTFRWPDRILAQVHCRTESGSAVRFQNTYLTLRASPSSSAHLGPTGVQ